MREPTISSSLFDTLSFFAQGCTVFEGSIPSGLPNPELFPLLVEQKLVDEIPINPNDYCRYAGNQNCRCCYVISPKGKELYLLEKEIRDVRAKHDAQQDAQDRSQRMQAVKDKKQELRHNYSVAAFSELVSAGLPHFAPKLIDLVKALIKSFLSQ